MQNMSNTINIVPKITLDDLIRSDGWRLLIVIDQNIAETANIFVSSWIKGIKLEGRPSV